MITGRHAALCAAIFAASIATPALASAQTSERAGFTLLVDAGLGIQSDTGVEETAAGLGGVNLGLGGFVTDKLAIMGRFSGTVASYDFGRYGDYTQTSGVVGATVQLWPADRFNIEAGGGLGYWTADSDSETSPGLILGAGITVLNRGKHNLQVGVEYAPVFSDYGTIHNIGITFGYQLF